MAIAATVLLPIPVSAQSSYGSIVGTVTDTSGAVIAGATVTITNLATNENHSAKSDASGNFSFVNLVPANYKLEAEQTNFKRFVRQPINLPVGTTARINPALPVGAITETVEVTTQAPLLQADSGTLSTQVQGQTVTEMPLNGRNSMGLIALAAGVVPQGSTSGSTGMNQTNSGHTNWMAWNNFQIGGSLAGESNVYIDGAPNNTLGSNTVGLVMTQDAVQEFTVSSNDMTADFGRNGGAVVNMASKGGTNTFHGSLYEYFRNTLLNSNEFFNKQSELSSGKANKPLKWIQNQYGGTVGGPIKKDKIFFYVTWEGFKAITSSAQNEVMPSTGNGFVVGSMPPNQKAGEIPLTAVDNGLTVAPGTVSSVTMNGVSYDPAKTTGLGNPACTSDKTSNPGYITVPQSCWDPMAVQMMKFYPAPNGSFLNGQANYYVAVPTADTQRQYNIRGDYVLSSKQRIFARYTHWYLHDTGQDLLMGNGMNGLTANSATQDTSHQAVLGDTYTFTPTTVLSLTLSYLRQNDFDSLPASIGTDPAKFPGTYYPVIAAQMGEHVLPTVGIGSNSTYNMTNFGRSSMNMGNWFNTFAIGASLTKIRGRHNMKVGTEVRLMQDTNMGGGGNTLNSGNFNFNGNQTGDPWADFLLGYVNNNSGSLGLTAAVTTYNYYQSYYATDNWQVSRKLTLSLGLRWELPGGIYEKHGYNTVLLPNYQWTYTAPASTGAFAGTQIPITGAYGLVNSTLYADKSTINVKHKSFAPRVGFAYRVGSSMAIRGGYGISYLPVDTRGGMMAQSSPVITQTDNCGGFTSNNKQYPNFAQRMFNCFGQTTAGGTTYNPTIITPPARKYNGGDLITYKSGGVISGGLNGAMPNQKTPYVQQWNLSVSRTFMGATVAELGYAGALGTHLPGLGTNFNELPDSQWLQWNSSHTANLLGTTGGDYKTSTNYNTLINPANRTTACKNLGGALGNGNITQAACNRPYPWFGNISDSVNYTASSIYHSMQLKVEKRFRGGGTIMGNYTWAKIIGNTDSSMGSFLESNAGAGSLNGPGGGSIQDYNNLAAERSVMQFDVPHRAVISYVLTLPFGKGQRFGSHVNGAVNRLIGGWGVNGIITFQRGFHLAFSDTTITTTTPAAAGGGNVNNELSQLGFGAQRPNFKAGCNKKQGLTGSYADRVLARQPQFNAADDGTHLSFGCWSQPGDFTPGNSPRVDPTLFAEGIDNFDFSAMKTTDITERFKLQFRAEFFNLFNRIQFAPPVTAVGQFSGTSPVLGLNYATIGNPRLVQLSMRVNF